MKCVNSIQKSFSQTKGHRVSWKLMIKYQNCNLCLWFLVYKTYIIFCSPQECDASRVGVIITYKPGNWGSSASPGSLSGWLSWVSNLPLHPRVLSTTYHQLSKFWKRPALPQWNFLFTCPLGLVLGILLQMERVFTGAVFAGVTHIWMSIGRRVIT